MATTMERDARLAVLLPYLLLAAVALLVLAVSVVRTFGTLRGVN